MIPKWDNLSYLWKAETVEYPFNDLQFQIRFYLLALKPLLPHLGKSINDYLPLVIFVILFF